MSDRDIEFGLRLDPGAYLGVSQLWALEASSSIVPNMQAVSLHRGFRDFEAFVKHRETENEKQVKSEMGHLEHTFRRIGVPSVVILRGAAIELIADSNLAGEVVKLETASQNIIDGVVPVTTYQ